MNQLNRLSLGVVFLLGTGSAFARTSLTFSGKCNVDIKGETVLTSDFDLDTETKNPAYEDLDINVPNPAKVYTKFKAQARLYNLEGGSTVVDFSVVSKGKPIASSYSHGVRRGTIITFSTRLLDDSRVICVGHVL